MATKKAANPGAKKAMSKNGLITAISETIGDDVTRKQVKAVLESLIEVGHKELKKSKIFTLPGFAKFRVVAKPATKGRRMSFRRPMATMTTTRAVSQNRTCRSGRMNRPFEHPGDGTESLRT